MGVLIQAAKTDQIDRHSSDWAFVDLGFAEKSKSCGAIFGDGVAEEMQFSDLLIWLQEVVYSSSRPLNLILEAPLSVAFNSRGNPTGRAIERRGSVTRYWYVGLGSTVLLAATYVLRFLSELEAQKSIRLIEGLASFKPRDVASSHAGDVLALRDVAWGVDPGLGKIIPPSDLKRNATDTLHSAFAVSGMEYGIPPVVALGA